MVDFTESKSRVREINLKGLVECLGVGPADGSLSYLGLPSPGLADVLAWRDYLGRVDAVERGVTGREWRTQHDLAVNAIVYGIRGFRLLRGDIDEVILNDRDSADQTLKWPYDVVNLDYSGGLLYKKPGERSKRVDAICRMVEEQGLHARGFFLSVTVNDRHQDAGEVSQTLTGIAHDLRAEGHGDAADGLIALASDGDSRMRLFVYLAHTVLTVGRQWFLVRPLRPVLYDGLGGYSMLNVSFCFKPVQGRSAPGRLGTSYRKLVNARPLVL